MNLLKSLAVADGVSEIILSKPENYNALSSKMIQELSRTLKALSRQRGTRAIILSGEGRGFCAGHDLKEINANKNSAFYSKLMRSCKDLMLAIQAIPQPVIAQIHGIATAAGCQLAATCDLAYAAADSKFATPGVMIGLFCSTPMLPLSRTVLQKHAMEMLLLGEPISAQRAVEIGLINAAVDPALLRQHVLTVAEKIAAKSKTVIGLGKKAYYKQTEMNLKQAYAFASQVMVKNLMNENAREGIRCFLEKTKPVWPDAKGSPKGSL